MIEQIVEGGSTGDEATINHLIEILEGFVGLSMDAGIDDCLVKERVEGQGRDELGRRQV